MSASPGHPHHEHRPFEPALPDGIEKEIAKEPRRWKRALLILGPGLISGASNDDPSAIGTYASAGAAHGYAMLWLAPVLFPMMAAVVYVCGKIGLVSGRGLAEVLRDFYPRWVMYPVLFALFTANVIGAGADLGAIAAGIGLVVPIPSRLAVVVVAAAILAIQVRGSYQAILGTFKWLALALFAYVGAGLLAKPDLADVLRHTVVPTVSTSPGFIAVIVAMVGTALSPYLYFWQSSQQIEEKTRRGKVRLRERRGASEGELRYASLDVLIGMFFACVVIYFIILACGATLHQAGRTRIDSAAEAAAALAPLAGRAASLLFAIGFVGSGFLAVPVLTTGAAYAFAEALGWHYGLDKKPNEARRFYVVIGLATACAVAFNFAGVNPIRALLLAATINGLLAPPLLALILHASNRRLVMGDRTNGWITNVLGGITLVATAAAAVAMIIW